MGVELERWSSTQRRTRAGAVESAQTACVAAPVVDRSERGAHLLGRAYFDAVEEFTHRIVRVRELGGELELRLLGRGPRLLSFGEPELRVDGRSVECRYPIRGGLLARAPGGAITLGQTNGDTVELTSTITGFYPRLAARPGRPTWTGGLYGHVQARLHVRVSRHYFMRLLATPWHAGP